MTQLINQHQTELANVSEEEMRRDRLRKVGIRPPTRPLRRDRQVVRPRPRAVAWFLRLAERVGL
jgi:hypothetical protein